jgi:DNA-binding IclR family transcriptional regulator
MRIVEILRRQRGGVPVDFIATATGRNPSEVLRALSELQKDGVIERRGDRVVLK